MGYHTKFGGIAPGIPPKGAKNVFFSGRVRIQRGVAATYPARISTIFETTDASRCENFQISKKN